MNETQLTNLLGAMALALSDAQDAAARAASGLGTSACSALVVLNFYPGTPIRTLAEILGLTHSVVVRLTEDLAGRGMVERSAGAKDKRQVQLRLTLLGSETAAAILDARRATLGAVLQRVPQDLRPALGDAVSHLLTALTQSRASADHICRLCDEDACPQACCPVECEAVRREGPRA
ncbi:MarR family transcriptional regulator [Aquabacter sp. L1I39]|uniref:MarR family winged helix-turn-helix transcriptional regulator n=1 Tax=Aquabacter sp. L1I39 TaxID=2820278 RepID=UPI001ADA2100|nr:MarR family transcriptional regulator [Aquabacter sp. L1I39]QTL03185.1 MarR family transcriptional regulator [Aquabacter sp. L1I39]